MRAVRRLASFRADQAEHVVFFAVFADERFLRFFSFQLLRGDPATVLSSLDAVVLSGGSAFGLSAADGVAAGLRADGRGILFISHRLDEVLHLVEEGRQTARDVAAGMHWDYRATDWSAFPDPQKWFATSEAASHLLYLVGQGKIAVDRVQIPWRFTRT